jgi:hypothetical protein
VSGERGGVVGGRFQRSAATENRKRRFKLQKSGSVLPLLGNSSFAKTVR